MADYQGSNLVYTTSHMSDNKAFRMQLDTLAQTGATTNQVLPMRVCTFSSFHRSTNILVHRKLGSVPILARVNFATIKNPTRAVECYHYLIDNLADYYLMGFTGAPYTLQHYNILQWTLTVTIIHPDIGMGAQGSSNNILNFGPYQYVVTIHDH
jgi:hypothetical protein